MRKSKISILIIKMTLGNHCWISTLVLSVLQREWESWRWDAASLTASSPSSTFSSAFSDLWLIWGDRMSCTPAVLPQTTNCYAREREKDGWPAGQSSACCEIKKHLNAAEEKLEWSNTQLFYHLLIEYRLDCTVAAACAGLLPDVALTLRRPLSAGAVTVHHSAWRGWHCVCFHHWAAGRQAATWSVPGIS